MARQYIREVMIPSNTYFLVSFDTPHPTDEQFQAAAIELVESLRQQTRENDDPAFLIPALPGGRVCISVEEIEAGGLEDMGVLAQDAADTGEPLVAQGIPPEKRDTLLTLLEQEQGFDPRPARRRPKRRYDFSGQDAEQLMSMFP